MKLKDYLEELNKLVKENPEGEITIFPVKEEQTIRYIKA
jgi:hypothetical protein